MEAFLEATQVKLGTDAEDGLQVKQELCLVAVAERRPEKKNAYLGVSLLGKITYKNTLKTP